MPDPTPEFPASDTARNASDARPQAAPVPETDIDRNFARLDALMDKMSKQVYAGEDFSHTMELIELAMSACDSDIRAIAYQANIKELEKERLLSAVDSIRVQKEFADHIDTVYKPALTLLENTVEKYRVAVDTRNQLVMNLREAKKQKASADKTKLQLESERLALEEGKAEAERAMLATRENIVPLMRALEASLGNETQEQRSQSAKLLGEAIPPSASAQAPAEIIDTKHQKHTVVVCTKKKTIEINGHIIRLPPRLLKTIVALAKASLDDGYISTGELAELLGGKYSRLDSASDAIRALRQHIDKHMQDVRAIELIENRHGHGYGISTELSRITIVE